MPIVGITNRGHDLPEIGRIRKGSPKTNGKMGKDLDHFRFDLNPGEADVEKLLREIYGDKPNNIRIRLPFPTSKRKVDPVTGAIVNRHDTLWQDLDYENPNWDANYEAYMRHGLIYKSNGRRVMYRTDIRTGEVMVRNWEPVEACVLTTGEPVGTYKNKKGEEIEIPLKIVGRLQVILPEVERLCYFTVMTSSFYDVVGISSQLNTYIANWDDLRGIPFILTRRPKEVAVTIKGQRSRQIKSLIFLEADPEWVKAQLEAQRLQSLPSAPEISGQLEPPKGLEDNHEDQWDAPSQPVEASELIEDEDDDGVIDGEFKDAEPETVQNTVQNDGVPQRPYTFEQLKVRLLEISAMAEEKMASGEWDPAHPGATIGALENVFAGPDADMLRHSFTKEVFGEDSTKNLRDCDIKAISKWLSARPEYEGGPFVADEMAQKEGRLAEKYLRKQAGQMALETGDSVPF